MNYSDNTYRLWRLDGECIASDLTGRSPYDALATYVASPGLPNDRYLVAKVGEGAWGNRDEFGIFTVAEKPAVTQTITRDRV